MMRRMQTSKYGLEVIKSFEGFRARAAQLPDGRWTIGYSHTKTARENLRITPEDAEAILQEYDLPPVEQTISDSVLAPLNQNEFDALASFVFNIGRAAFLGSDMLSYLNAGKRLLAADALSLWRKAHINGRLITVDALVRRRISEQALFLKDPSGIQIAPSGFIHPLVRGSDYGALRESSPNAKESSPEPKPQIRPLDKSTPSENTAAKASARASRLTRELGKTEAKAESNIKAPSRPSVKTAIEPALGPTPDEITRAISALANPDGPKTPDIAKDMPIPVKTPTRPGPEPTPFDLDEDVLPPLPGMDYSDAEATKFTGYAPTGKLVIDDLETKAIDTLLLEHAITEADRGKHRTALLKEPNGLAYLMMALVGLIMAAIGAFTLRSDNSLKTLEAGQTSTYMGYAGLSFGVFLILLALYCVFIAKPRRD